MINSRKKGFTLVELVIVIAVVAILAAVLIPTFSSLIKKANVSNDTALVKNLNTALAADTDGQETMNEALQAANEFGYDIAKIQAKANGNKILWDSKNDCFVYLDSEKGLIYIPDSKKEQSSKNELWIISDVVDSEYSTYLYNYNGSDTVEAKHSLDVSACGAINVVYNGNASVSITTNGGSLTVNSGSVTHYGVGYILEVADSAKASYVEKGSFAAKADEIVNAGANNSEYTYVNNATELTAALASGVSKIALNANITINADPSVGNDFTITSPTEINLNNYNINSTHNSNTGVSKNNGVFYINDGASLKVTGAGEITFITNNQMGWNNCTYVIGGRGDVAIDGAIKIANLGGTDMSYAIDMYSYRNSDTATITIELGMVYSAQYCAIRLNKQGNNSGDKTKTFNLIVNGGTILSEIKSPIFAHDGSEASDGIYNITINGGVVASNADKKCVSTWGWNTETVNVSVTSGKILKNGVDVTSSYK